MSLISARSQEKRLNEYHCNIGKIRKTECNSRKNVIKYMMKEDKDIMYYGCDLNTKNNKRTNISLKLMNGSTLLDILNQFPEEYYNYDKLRRINLLYQNQSKNTISSASSSSKLLIRDSRKLASSSFAPESVSSASNSD